MAACSATPIAPAAPLCGILASKMVDAVSGIFSDTGTGCAIDINGQCGWRVLSNYREELAKGCPPGDEWCKALVRAKVKAFNDQAAKEYQTPVPPMPSPPGNKADGSGPNAWDKAVYKSKVAEWEKQRAAVLRTQDKGAADYADFKKMAALALPITLAARVNAERAFYAAVQKTAVELSAPYVAKCPSGACIDQARGIMAEAALDAGVKQREQGEAAARMILSSAQQQADGVLASSLQVNALEKKQHVADFSKAEAEAEAFFDGVRNRRIALAGLAVLAAAGAAYAVRKRSR
jgi:hypothetical protein